LLPALAPGVPFGLLALYLFGDVLKALVAVLLLRRFGGEHLRFDTLRTVGIYLACAVVAAPALSAFIGAAGRATLGADYWPAWMVWFLGDALANLLIAPALLLWVPRPHSLSRYRVPEWRTLIEALALATGVLVVGSIIFLDLLPIAHLRMTQLYLITPLLLWAAVRFGPTGTSAALAGTALLAITGAAIGNGPFAASATSTNIVGLQIFLAVTAVPLILLAAVISERKHSEQEVEVLASRLLQMQDEERRRIARELHDSTAQTVAAVKLNFHKLRTQLKNVERDGSTYTRVLDESEALTDQVATDLRTLSYLLHPPLLDELGLVVALQWYVEGFAQRSKLLIELLTPDDLGRFPMQVEMALYRIVQEGLANVYRHSHSSGARVTLSKRGSTIYLQIQDWGKGIAAALAEEAEVASADEEGASSEGTLAAPLLGVGIAGMRRRLQQLGGRLEIDSTSYGTTITAFVPLAADPGAGESRSDEHGSTEATPKQR
jgi:signal transduction histidine kinase